MEIMNTLFELIRADGSIIVNKKLAKNLGLKEAIMYSELISKQKYFEAKGGLTDDGFFFNTVENMEEDTTLSDHEQRKAIKKLVKEKLIFAEIRGVPAKRYFKVRSDYEALESIKKCLQSQENQQFLKNLKTRSEKIEELDLKKLKTNNTNTNNTKFNNTKNNHNGVFAVAENTHVYSFQKEIVEVIQYYFSLYKQKKKKKHPNLKPKQHQKVLSTLTEFGGDYALSFENWQAMIDRHFERNMDTDHNINHFATEGVLTNLMYEAGYYG